MSSKRSVLQTSQQFLVLVLASAAFTGIAASAQDDQPANPIFTPGNILVSRSVYYNDRYLVPVGQILPPFCSRVPGGCAAPTGAPFDGTYPTVWNNNLYDGSFGVTSKILLDQLTPIGSLVSTIEVPNNQTWRIQPNSDQLVTSFSSKSELSLNLSTSHRYVTFMGYVATIGRLDLSNSSTPGVVDPTNPVGEAVYRAVAKLDRYGNFSFTETNAYSGNNGRAAILNDSIHSFYTAGNAGNGANPEPAGVLLGAGAQLIPEATTTEYLQSPATPTPVGSFNVTQLGVKADKIGKDDNFRGMTIFNNVLYYTKGSGGNGVNTVYFVDTTGTACPNGTGLPVAGAALPTTPLSYDATKLVKSGLPSNICILTGFPTNPAKTTTVTAFPFGIWFANAKTVYVADEGDGYQGGSDLYTHAAAQTTAGLQKWIFNSTAQSWQLAYVLQNGLNLGQTYPVAPSARTHQAYPTTINAATGLPWSPATDGLRNITGRFTGDDTVTIWAITSTISGSGDQGADPNQLVSFTDNIENTDPINVAPATILKTAGFGEVLRGVSLTPGTDSDN